MPTRPPMLRGSWSFEFVVTLSEKTEFESSLRFFTKCEQNSMGENCSVFSQDLPPLDFLLSSLTGNLKSGNATTRVKFNPRLGLPP